MENYTSHLRDFERQFPDSDTLINHLVKVREAIGVFNPERPECDFYYVPTQKAWRCRKTKYRQTLKKGNFMEGSKMPIYIWFKMLYLVSQAKLDISALTLQKLLGIKTYETALYMYLRIKEFIADEVEKYYAKGLFETCRGAEAPCEMKEKTSDGKYLERNILLLSQKKANPEFPTTKVMMLLLEPQANNLVSGKNPEQLQPSKRFKKVLRNRHLAFEPVYSAAEKFKPNVDWIRNAYFNVKVVLEGVHKRVSVWYAQLYLMERTFKHIHRNNQNIFETLVNRAMRPRVALSSIIRDLENESSLSKPPNPPSSNIP
ncbi:MAG: hypothetical protein RL226_576 [Bacteroidota bacterium]